MALRDQANAGAKQDFRCHGGRKREGNERVMGMGITFGYLSAAGIRGAAGFWNVRVLRHHQRIEAARLGLASQFANIDAIISRKITNSNTHFQFSSYRSPPIIHSRRSTKWGLPHYRLGTDQTL